MRHLTVDGTTYDTVGEASVTQVQTSGTKIATMSIDGTSTDIYAPSGGSSISPYTSNPAMDGTASAGSSDNYARGDHVHPTDTGRASSTHTHGSITNAGAITSDTSVASGDKLVISDSSDSSKLKRSGISFGSSTTAFLRNDGTWQVPSGGGDVTSDDVTVDVAGYASEFADAWSYDVYDVFTAYLVALGWDESTPVTLTEFLCALGNGIVTYINNR